MRPLKVCVCVFSRANFGRLKAVIDKFDKDNRYDLQLMLGASYYNQEIGYKVDSRIQCLIADDTHEAMALTTGIALTKISGELARLSPDVVFVHGDRYEMLACAIAASYMNIPIAHTEGGECTGCIDDKVRNAITALADIHFVVTELARIELQMHKGISNVHTVGSTALDWIHRVPVKKDNHVLVLHHSETTEEEDIMPLIDALNILSNNGENIIWANPNVDAGNKKILKEMHKLDFEFKKDLSPDEYIELLRKSKCLIGNTSSGIKEGSYLGIPYVCIGNRQLGREFDHNTTFSKMKTEDIINKFQFATSGYYEKSDYFGDGRASELIADILCKVVNAK